MNKKAVLHVLLLLPLLASCGGSNRDSKYEPTINDFKICPQKTIIPSDYANLSVRDNIYFMYAYSDYPFLDEFEFVSFGEGCSTVIEAIDPNEVLTDQKIIESGDRKIYYRQFQVLMTDFTSSITSALFKRGEKVFEVDIGLIKKTESYGEKNSIKDIWFRPALDSLSIYNDCSFKEFDFYLYNGKINSLDKIKINDTYVDFVFNEDLNSLEKNKHYTISVTIPKNVIDFNNEYGTYTFTLEYHHYNNAYVYQSTARYNYVNQRTYILYGDYYSY